MQLTPHFTLRVIVILLLGGSCALFANILSFTMIGRINQRLPESERMSYFWWGTQVRRRYKKLYPGSRLVLLLDLCKILLVLCFPFLIWFWVFGNA